jgi:hypothetical protein
MQRLLVWVLSGILIAGGCGWLASQVYAQQQSHGPPQDGGADAETCGGEPFGMRLSGAYSDGMIAEAGLLLPESAFYEALRNGEKALELANEGRARVMSEALKLQALEFPADKRQRVDDLLKEFRIGELTIGKLTFDWTKGSERAAAVNRLCGVRRELLGLARAVDTTGSGSALAQAQAIAGEGGAVAVLIVTKVGGKILIVTNGEKGHSGITIVNLPELTTKRLNLLMYGEAKDGKRGGWRGAYNINYLPPDE